MKLRRPAAQNKYNTFVSARAEIINCKTCFHILRNVVKEGHFSWKNIDCGYCMSTQDVETNQEINEQKS